MPTYIALLRAVNVGGTGKLAMSDLKKICEDATFTNVATYIASGNVAFRSKLGAAKAKAALESRLNTHMGKSVGVIVRTAAEMAAVLKANPFSKAPGNYTYAIFLEEAPPKDALRTATGGKNEELRLGKREIYVFYPDGMGRSKLKIPAAKAGTARNMNTVAALVAMAAERT